MTHADNDTMFRLCIADFETAIHTSRYRKVQKKTPEIWNDQIGLKVRPITLTRKVGHGQFRILIKEMVKRKH